MSKKKKKQKTNVMRILDQKNISYNEYEFDWSEDHLSATYVADKLAINPEKIFKTLVATGHQTGPIVAIIPGNKEVDLKKLAQVSGNKKVDMLQLKHLEATTGYIRGGCSPIGMKKLFPTYLAEEADQWEQIIISAGKRGQQVELSPKELLTITNGKKSAITVSR